MSIISRAHFPPAGAIIDDFLLVLQISEVSTDDRPKFVIISARTLVGVGGRERAASKQQKSGNSSLDGRHRFCSWREAILYLCCGRPIIPTRKLTKLRASFGNVTLMFE